MADEKNLPAVVQKSGGIVSEFKKFISRGNVIDMAVGIIIGSAFTAIVNSIVNDIIMPFIGLAFGGINLSGMSLQINQTIIPYGSLLQAILNFFIIAVCVFIMVKLINALRDKKKKHEEEAPPAPPKPDPQTELLAEIRDLLKEQNNK